MDGSWKGRLLDLGCGNGQFLARMRELGWDTLGIEPDPEAAKIARDNHGLEVYVGAVDEVGLPADLFDVITMSHVIEHLPDPIHILRVCGRLLRRGGRLVMITPNIGGLGHRLFGQAWRGLDPPRHIMLFSVKTLRACAESAGLDVVELWTSTSSAPMMWARSRIIQRQGKLPSLDPFDLPRRYLKVEGRLFWIVEHLATHLWPCGEEIVMIARKG